MDADEAGLIAQAQQGDKEAFRRLYEATAGFVYNTARRVLGRAEDAEEVVQDVFVAAHRSLGGFRGDAALRTWLYRITVNLALNKIKSTRRQRQEVVYEDYMDTTQGIRPDQRLQAEDTEQRVRLLLGALPEDFRACLVLREIEGLSYEEIARTLNININTVRTRILRARKQLAAAVREGVGHAL